jgi:hypothetical protein
MYSGGEDLYGGGGGNDIVLPAWWVGTTSVRTYCQSSTLKKEYVSTKR